MGNVVPGLREVCVRVGGSAALVGRRGGGVKRGVNMVNKSSTTKTGSHYLIDRKLTPKYLIGRKLTPRILWTGSWHSAEVKGVTDVVLVSLLESLWL